jgi:hypothetical protein
MSLALSPISVMDSKPFKANEIARRPSTISCGRGGRSGFDLIHSIHEQEFSPLEC